MRRKASPEHLCFFPFHTFVASKTYTMENTNVNNLIEEGKKQLAALQVELTKLADTAESSRCQSRGGIKAG